MSDTSGPVGKMRLDHLGACIAGFLFAALAPACVAAGISQSIKVLPLALVVTLGHTVLLGLPLFLLLQSKGWVNVISLTAGGFVVGAIPAGVLWLLALGGKSSSSINGVPMIVDGWPTAAGLLYQVQFSSWLGSFGALAGFVLWLTLKLSGCLTQSGNATVAGNKRNRHGGTTAWRLGLATIAVLLTCAVFAIPSVTKDRTCHNMFRDGRSTVSPKVRVELDIPINDWPKLANLFERFGLRHELSLRNSGQVYRDTVETLSLSLCSESGVNVSADDQRWASMGFAPLIAGRGVPIDVYELRKGSGWEEIASGLVVELESAWPGKVGFRDGDGHLIPKPKELQVGDARAR